MWIGGRCGVGFVCGGLFEGIAQHVQQFRKRSQVIVLHGGGEGFFDFMVSRDVDGIDPVHGLRPRLRVHFLPRHSLPVAAPTASPAARMVEPLLPYLLSC